MMKSMVLAGVAAAFVVAGASASFAQNVDPAQPGNAYHTFKRPEYRPLRVRPRVAPAPAPVGPGEALGSALAAPIAPIAGVGGPIGVAGGIASGAVTGATNLAFAPLGVLTGGTAGISPVAAPPLPIVARYAGTGKVVSSYDEGYAQDVPVDASGPIYKLDYKESGVRTVTPFTLLAFPVSAATTAVLSPVRALTSPVVPH